MINRQLLKLDRENIAEKNKIMAKIKFDTEILERAYNEQVKNVESVKAEYKDWKEKLRKIIEEHDTTSLDLAQQHLNSYKLLDARKDEMEKVSKFVADLELEKSEAQLEVDSLKLDIKRLKKEVKTTIDSLNAIKIKLNEFTKKLVEGKAKNIKEMNDAEAKLISLRVEYEELSKKMQADNILLGIRERDARIKEARLNK